MNISRTLEQKITDSLQSKREVVVLYGARQVGKTTLIHNVLHQLKLKTLFINGDEMEYHDVLNSRNKIRLQNLVSGYEVLFIDEAQQIENIGINIKILYDSLPELKIILSGSSSLDLANKVQEPLTGRTESYLLFPLSYQELTSLYNPYELDVQLQNYLVYGAYPKLLHLNSVEEKISMLRELTSAYLYKDILQLAQIKHSDKLQHLLKLLAFQIGNIISVHELSNQLKISSETVERYLDLLEKSFVILRLSGYSNNLRKEISKQRKIYFYDLGVRNMLINNFSHIDERQDIGALWENFILMERIKKMNYEGFNVNTYFWRTYTGAELDFVEEKNGKLNGYEFKWGNKTVKAPKTWLETYQNAEFELINRENYQQFIL